MVHFLHNLPARHGKRFSAFKMKKGPREAVKRIHWILLLAWVLPGLLQGQLYYWVDAAGVQHYSSTPPESREGIRDFRVFEATGDAPVQGVESGAGSKAGLPGKTIPSVVMYTTSR